MSPSTSPAARHKTAASPAPDVSFHRRLTARDPAALTNFFERYFEPIHARVRRLVRDPQEVEDVTQEIFLSIHRSLPRFDPTQRLEPWIFTIVMNRIRDRWRSVSARAAEELPEGRAEVRESAESDAERREREEQLREAVHALPLGVRSVLLLRVYDGLSFRAIAEVMNLAPAAARKRHSRAVQALRKTLSPQGART